jgi:type 1 fimbriae regulatory protein FimB/type 1 fimbriae regulatory protein FimE
MTTLTRTPNAKMRPSGENLSDAQVRQLIKAARGNRYGARDALMIELAWYHGLRSSEVCALTWEDIRRGRKPTLFIRRAKGGSQHENPLTGEHLRALSALKPDEPGATIFTTERGEAFTPGGFAKMVERAGVAAGFKFKVHPHQLRHACAGHLASKMTQLDLAGHLGMKNPGNLTEYYRADPERRRNVW